MSLFNKRKYVTAGGTQNSVCPHYPYEELGHAVRSSGPHSASFCDLVGAMFSASFSSSKIFFAEEGDVNILL